MNWPALEDRQKLDEAEASYKECLNVIRTHGILGLSHPRTLFLANRYGYLLDELGREDEAIALYDEVIDAEINHFGADHWLLADGLTVRGLFLADLDEDDRAEADYQRALKLYRDNPEKPNRHYSDCLSGLADLQEERDDYAQAEGTLREALERSIARNGEGTGPESARIRAKLGGVLSHLGKNEEAVSLLNQSIDAYRTVRSKAGNQIVLPMELLGEHYWRLGDLDTAETHYREMLATDRRNLGNTHSDVAYDLEHLAGLLVDARKSAEAVTLISEAWEIRKADRTTSEWDIAHCLAWLAMACLDSGDLDGYRSACEELIGRFPKASNWDYTRLMVETLVAGPDAVADFETVRALAERSRKTEAPMLIGAALVRSGQAEEAITHLKPARSPLDALAMVLALRALGRETDADSLMETLPTQVEPGISMEPPIDTEAWSDRARLRSMLREVSGVD